MKNTLLRCSAFAAAALLTTMSSHAAELKKPDGYPERSVSIIVPYGAGGGSDQVARAWSKAMQSVADIPFQVENKPGGGGLAATPDFISRPKDGYTILQQTDGLISAGAANQVEAEVGEDIVPICFTQATFSQIYIRPNETRFTDWASLVDYAKKNPGKLTLANIGVEKSMEVIQVNELEQAAGIKFKTISYDKPTERYAALLGAHADVLFEQPGDVRKFLEAKQMKPVLSVIKEAPQAFSDVPSLKEAKLDIPVLLRVRGFWIHKDVADDRKAYLRQACKLAFETEDYQKFNKAKYMHLARSYYEGDDAVKLVKDMLGTYRKAIK
ncbi:MAG: tripartite tricarboxylate transporter substrate binding protein [Alphaproteobacteria bacterium]|nr:tripartite tricarboxylate transporter substrate binding protein [Alphaproteobacteria bacterium]